jgi:V/A-type H+-transporting ATPase subunit K
MRKSKIGSRILFINSIAFAIIVIGACASFAESQPATAAAIAKSPTMPAAVGFLSAALAVGLSCLAAGIAVKSVGSAAMGAIAEKPELTGRALIFVGLAEGIAIYGLIVAIMILGKL